MFQSRTENQTHFMFNNFFFFKNRAFYEIISKKYGGASGSQTTSQYAYALTRCMLDKQGYMRARACACPRSRHTHARARAHTSTQICNIYCFSTATVVTWTRLNITLYVHCLPCYIFKFIFSYTQIFCCYMRYCIVRLSLCNYLKLLERPMMGQSM